MSKSGTLRVGLGWAAASSRGIVSSSVAHSDARSPSVNRILVQRFLDLLFTARCCRSAFVQCVDASTFIGRLADGNYTALETVARLQGFVDTARQFTVRRLVIDNDQAFARLERAHLDDRQPSDHLIQLSVANGKIVEYLGSLQD